MHRIYLLTVLLVISQLVVSQLDEEIDAVEVITLNIPIEVEKSGRSVTILTAEEISQLPVTSVEEALRFLPGVNVNSRGGFGVQSDIGMRGSTFSQVLFLIDGVRWNEPLTAHFNNTIPIPLSEIEKIEVLRGPASAVYGADAVGGVIHIQTRTFSNTKQQGFSTKGNYLYGSNELNDLDASLNVGLEKFKFSAGAKKTVSNGEQFTNPNFSAGVSDVEVYNTDFDIETITLASQYKPDENWTINSRFAQDKRDFDAKYYYTRSPFDESRETTDSYYAQLNATRSANSNTTNISVGYKQTDDIFAFNPTFPSTNYHTTNRWTGVVSHHLATKNNHQFAFGSQYEFQEIESTDRGNHDQKQLEFFATSRLELNEDLSAVLSARGGNNDAYGFKFTPQASLAYHQPNYVLRASAGRAIRGADFTERYVSFLIPDLTPERNIGNPDLDVETSTTVDAGTDFFVGDYTDFSVTTFFRTSDNLIDYAFVNSNEIDNAPNLQPDQMYFQTRNVGAANTFGIEFQKKGSYPVSSNMNFTTDLNFTFLNTNIKDDLASKYLANHPNHQANIQLGLNSEKWGFMLSNQYINRNAEAIADIQAEIKDDYFLSHARANFKVIDEAELTVKVNNVFDTKYQEILGSQMPGRWLSGGIRWNLD